MRFRSRNVFVVAHYTMQTTGYHIHNIAIILRNILRRIVYKIKWRDSSQSTDTNEDVSLQFFLYKKCDATEINYT